MEARKLGRTDIMVPPLGLGTWGLCGSPYGPVSDSQVSATLAHALEMGTGLFDMAPTWGAEGRSESRVADAVGERRDEVVYVTRAGMQHGEYGPQQGFSQAELRASCEASLTRLRTDRIDVLLLHNPDVDTLQSEDAIATCEALVQEGKVRAWGASVSEADAARAAIQAGAQVLCMPHHMLRPELLWMLESNLLSQEVGVLASSPLCHGMLAGRWSLNKGFASNDHRHRRWSREAMAVRTAAVQRLRKYVKGDILSLASAALRFAVCEPSVATALIGARTPGQLESAVRGLGEPPLFPPEARTELRSQAGF